MTIPETAAALATFTFLFWVTIYAYHKGYFKDWVKKE